MNARLYSLSANSNSCWALDDEAIEKLKCKACGCYTAAGYASFKPKKVKHPLSATWDGALVATEEFRKFYVEREYGNIEFLPTQRPGFYSLKINSLVEFDTEKRSPEFRVACKRCSVCGRFFVGDAAVSPFYSKQKDLPPGLHIFDLAIQLEDAPMSSRLWFCEVVSAQTLEDLRQAGFRALALGAKPIGLE